MNRYQRLRADRNRVPSRLELLEAAVACEKERQAAPAAPAKAKKARKHRRPKKRAGKAA